MEDRGKGGALTGACACVCGRAGIGDGWRGESESETDSEAGRQTLCLRVCLV